jgi:hypothetical protein
MRIVRPGRRADCERASSSDSRPALVVDEEVARLEPVEADAGAVDAGVVVERRPRGVERAADPEALVVVDRGATPPSWRPR